MTRQRLPFWQRMTLDQLSPEQWESLCDGCGKCCLHKLEDADTRQVFFSNVACRFFDLESGLCRHYAQRSTLRPDCVQLTSEIVARTHWLPATCAYRLLAAGGDLPAWHPLLTGDPSSVLRSGNSVLGRVVPETAAGPLEHNLIDWVT